MPRVDKILESLPAPALDALFAKILEIRSARARFAAMKPYVVTARPPKGKDGKYWQLRVYNPDGSETQKSARPATTREEAEAAAVAYASELNNPGPTLVEVLDKRIRRLEAERAPKGTISGLRTARSKVGLPLGGLPPTKANLLKVRDDLLAEGKAASTINTYFGSASSAWNWAEERGTVSDRWPEIKRLAERKTELRPCLPEESARMMAYFLGRSGTWSWEGPYFGVLADTGSRVTETLLLEHEDLDRARSEIVFRADRTKRETWRRVAVSPEVLALIPAGQGRIWPELNDRRVRLAWGRALKACGLDCEPIRPHSLRRSWISDAFEALIPLPHIMEQVGHRNPRTTLRYQQNATRRDLARSVKTLADWRQGADGGSPRRTWGGDDRLAGVQGGPRAAGFMQEPDGSGPSVDSGFGEATPTVVSELAAALGDPETRRLLRRLLDQLDE